MSVTLVTAKNQNYGWKTRTCAHARKTRKATNTHRQPMVHTQKSQNPTRTLHHFLPLTYKTNENVTKSLKKGLHQHFLTLFFPLSPSFHPYINRQLLAQLPNGKQNSLLWQEIDIRSEKGILTEKLPSSNEIN